MCAATTDLDVSPFSFGDIVLAATAEKCRIIVVGNTAVSTFFSCHCHATACTGPLACTLGLHPWNEPLKCSLGLQSRTDRMVIKIEEDIKAAYPELKDKDAIIVLSSADECAYAHALSSAARVVIVKTDQSISKIHPVVRKNYDILVVDEAKPMSKCDATTLAPPFADATLRESLHAVFARLGANLVITVPRDRRSADIFFWSETEEDADAVAVPARVTLKKTAPKKKQAAATAPAAPAPAAAPAALTVSDDDDAADSAEAPTAQLAAKLAKPRAKPAAKGAAKGVDKGDTKSDAKPRAKPRAKGETKGEAKTAKGDKTAKAVAGGKRRRSVDEASEADVAVTADVTPAPPAAATLKTSAASASAAPKRDDDSGSESGSGSDSESGSGSDSGSESGSGSESESGSSESEGAE